MSEGDTGPQNDRPTPALRPPRPSARRIGRVLGALAVALVMVVAVAAGWIVLTTPGAAWVFARVPGLQVVSPRGTLLGTFTAQRVEYSLYDATTQPATSAGNRVVLTRLEWQGLSVRPASPGAGRVALHWRALRAQRVDVIIESDPKAAAATPPSSLRLPLQLEADAVAIGELHAPGIDGTPLRDLRGRVALGAEAGQAHRVDRLSMRWDRVTASGAARIATDAPFALQLTATGRIVPAAAAASAAGTAPVGASASAPIAAARAVVPAAVPPLDAQLQVQGTLTAMTVHAAVRALDATAAVNAGAASSPAPGRPSPAPSTPAARLASADLDVALRPFDAWPLGDLDARVAALDLSQLATAAPRTLLDGTVQLTSSGPDRPAHAAIELRNAGAGRSDEGRIPVHELAVEAQARPDRLQEIALSALDVQLGTAAEPAGHVRGSGHWAPPRAQLALILTDVQPQRLDGRAPVARISGPLMLEAVRERDATAGLPLSIVARGKLAGSLRLVAAARARKLDAAASATVSTSTSPPAPTVATDRALALDLDTTLHLDAAGAVRALAVRRADLSAGTSRVSLQADAERTSSDARAGGLLDQGWKLNGTGALQQFDPLPWWPAAPSWVAGTGASRVDAAWQLNLTVPPQTGTTPASRSGPNARLATARGGATLTLADSTLAGVPLSGRVSLQADASTPARLDATLDVAGNSVQAHALADPRGAGTQDHATVTTQGVALRRLTPLLRLARAAGLTLPARIDANAPLAGTVDAEVQLDGRWPTVTTRGTLAADNLQAGDLRLNRARAHWLAGTSWTAPLDVRAELNGLQWAGVAQKTTASVALAPPPTTTTTTNQAGTSVTTSKGTPDTGTTPAPGQSAAGPATLDSATLTLQGTAAEHQLELQAASPLKPPVWIDLLQAATPSTTGSVTGTLATLDVRGGASLDATGRLLRWQGRIAKLDLHGRGSRAAPWAAMADVPLQLQWPRQAAEASTGADAPRVSLGAGRVALPGAGVRWTQVQWQGGAAPQLEMQAELEPITVAPLLSRLQPEFGWGGDLIVAGHFNVRSAPVVSADIVIQRQSGDLTVDDENGRLPLGLSDMRLGLQVEDGVWRFFQGLAGNTLGAMAGAVSVRTGDPRALWPGPQAPMAGVLEARVANLAAWGAWVPAGWRLGGVAHATATIGGRFREPEITGEVDGRALTVRNLLEGIDLQNGEVQVALQGATARIDRLHATAGSGRIDVTGNATFGATPQAKLKVVADKLLVLGRVDRRIVASGQVDVVLEPEQLKLEGQVTVDEGQIDFTRGDAPQLADDVEVIGRKLPGTDAAPARPYLRNVAMNLQLDLGSALRLRGRGLDTRLAGKLALTAPGGKLAINGTVRAVDGNYAAYGQKLALERGNIVFSGATDNPRLDILAIRPNLDVRVGVAITGTATSPRIKLYSDPDLSDIDKLSWLVLGRATDGLGTADTALLQGAALALLSGESEGALGGSLPGLIGLDQLSVRQTTDAADVRETVISLGKQISRRWYVGYERGLNATAGTWQLIYRVAQRFTLRAQGGLDNSVDFIWTWKWN